MSNKTKTYSIPAKKIYDTLGECLKNSDNFSEVILDDENLIIVAVTLAVANTHGEKIVVKINTDVHGQSNVNIESSSVVKEYDCGNNSVNVILMFRTIEQLFGIDKSKRKLPSFVDIKNRKEQVEQLESVTKSSVGVIKNIVKIAIPIIIVIALIIAFSNKGCGHPDCKKYGPFPCYGKDNTCTNTTDCYLDMYCDKCD